MRSLAASITSLSGLKNSSVTVISRWCCCGTGIASLEDLPLGLSTLEQSAFAGCYALANLRCLPITVAVHDVAFRLCTTLRDAVLANAGTVPGTASLT